MLSACEPALSTVPAAGEYAKLPATVELAFSCVALSAVPYGIAAGVGHTTVGFALFTIKVTEAAPAA